MKRDGLKGYVLLMTLVVTGVVKHHSRLASGGIVGSLLNDSNDPITALNRTVRNLQNQLDELRRGIHRASSPGEFKCAVCAAQ